MCRIILVLILAIFAQPLYAVPAKVTGSRVNVRAKPVLGSEIVTQVSLDEEVEVLEKGDEWTKIKAPVHSKCWIHNDYVESGKITAATVNLRCGPGIAFPVLCQLNRGTEINVIETAGDWIRIEPPVEFGVWVSTKYIEYPASAETEEETSVDVLELEKGTYIETGEEMFLEQEEIIEEPPVPVIVTVSQEEISGLELVSYIGILEDLGIILNRPGTYKLVSNDGKWTCILKSPTLDLNPYVTRLVRIEGVVVARASSWNVPVLEVKQLQVVK